MLIGVVPVDSLESSCFMLVHRRSFYGKVDEACEGLFSHVDFRSVDFQFESFPYDSHG